jgi:hypothetical protein
MNDENHNDYTFGGEPIGRDLMLELARESADIKRRDRERLVQENDRPEDCEAAGGLVHGCATREEAMAEIYARARLRHPDFDLLEPLMRVIAAAFQPKSDGSINFEEYLECLYVIAHYAYFTAPMRDKALLQGAPVISELKM